MAPKKSVRPPDELEPKESSEESQESETGGEEESDEESESETEEEAKTPQILKSSQVNKKPSMQKQINPPPAEPPAPQSPSDSEVEEEEEGDSDEEGGESDYSLHSPSASDFTIKPITPTKPTSKDSKATPKRPSEPQKDGEKDLGNRKKAKTTDVEDKKEKFSSVSGSASVGVGRVWSEEDQIGVLQGMIDYQCQKGAEPSADMGAFHEFIKGKLHAEVSKTQLYEKVRGLKKKYLNNVKKGENGEDPVFSKPHECKAFDLSKKIWGPKTNGVDDNVSTKSNNEKAKMGGKIGGNTAVVTEDEKKNVLNDDLRDYEGDFRSKYPHLCESFCDSSVPIADGLKSFLKDNLRLIDSAKSMELEEKWKKLREKEAEVFLKRLNLMYEHTRLVLNEMRKR